MPLQIRRGTKADLQAMTTPLATGELVWITDDKELYAGDGTTVGGILITTATDPTEAVGAALEDGVHASISFTYQSGTSTIDASVDLSAYNGDIVSANDGLDNLGAVDKPFSKLFLSENGLQLGTAEVTATGSIVNLPAGSTIGGSTIGAEIQDGSNLNINILSDDGSSMLVDASSGNFYGTLNGSVVANDLTVLVDSSANSLSTGELLISGTTISTSTTPLYLEGNLAGPTQLQVRYNLIAAGTTGGEIISASGDWNYVELFAYKGSKESPGDIASGDVLGTLGFGGRQGSTATDINSVIGVQCDPDGTTTGTHIPTKFFVINQPAVEGNDYPHLTFDSLGRLAVNRENAEATVDINGIMRLAPQSVEPFPGLDSSIPEGIVAIADGSGWDPMSTGKPTMVVRLGGEWVQLAVAP